MARETNPAKQAAPSDQSISHTGSALLSSLKQVGKVGGTQAAAGDGRGRGRACTRQASKSLLFNQQQTEGGCSIVSSIK